MIPLIPAVVLAFISFLASAFVILRTVIPILPPSPLSRRVSPSEFGLPAFGSLSPADKGHIWLASLDLLALIVFVWHVVAEATSGPVGAAIAQDPLAATRVWFVLTVRQGCLLMLAGLALLYVRMGRSFSLGKKHWILWAPVALLACTSTALAGVLAGAGVNGLFPGLAAYTGTFTILTTVSFATLFVTLYKIKKNLAALNKEEDDDSWPPAKQEEQQPRPSFGTDEIDVMKDGASWITSNASRRNSLVSSWSFSTHQTAVGSQHGSRPSSRNQWLSAGHNDEVVPPVPPLPSAYGLNVDSDPDPFRRNAPTPIKVPDHPHYRARVGSQTSWLTSNGSDAPPTSPWDFTPNASMVDLQTAVSRPATPGLATAQVLGGYGYAPNPDTSIESLAAPPGARVNWSLRPVIGWSIYTWLPFVLSIPYTVLLSQQATVSTTIYVLYTLSVTLSAPLLAFNLVFRAGLPIPTGLFDTREPIQVSTTKRVSTSPSELPQWKWSNEYKRSMSTTPTVVEGRPSGDVWIQKGDAVDGKSKFGRAVSMLTPTPKLSVLPPLGNDDEALKPPAPIHEGDSSLPVNIHSRSYSETSAQFGKLRSESKATTYQTNQTSSEEAAFQSKIMVAQRHYSAMAQTFVVPATSPEPTEEAQANATGVAAKKRTHLRNRSTTSSISGPLTANSSSYGNISPPPPFPLPPTPPNVRAARLLSHQKSFSSSYSFGPVDNMNEIDALTAGVLPLLVPGLKVGDDMKIKDGDYSPPGTFSKSKGKKAAKKMDDFGTDFSSPEVASTPAAGLGKRPRRTSHKTNFSLPSLSLSKDAIQALANDVRGALENNIAQYIAVPSSVVIDSTEEDEGAQLGRADSTRSLGLQADVPRSIGTSARSSMHTILEGPPPSSASDVTLFEDFEAGLMEKPDNHHSTPHNSVAGKAPRERAPPMPKVKKNRSSIVYIKSSENSAPAVPPKDENAVPLSRQDSTSSSIASWSAKVMSKTGSFKRKNQKPAESQGLRRLSLLQDRDTNSLKGDDSSPDSSKEFIVPKASSSVRPLTLNKKQRRAGNDENAIPEDRVVSGLTPRADGKSLKPLKLARSDTSRMRGILRRSEQLPEVVVRPPSMTDHVPFSYNFGQENL